MFQVSGSGDPEVVRITIDLHVIVVVMLAILVNHGDFVHRRPPPLRFQFGFAQEIIVSQRGTGKDRAMRPQTHFHLCLVYPYPAVEVFQQFARSPDGNPPGGYQRTDPRTQRFQGDCRWQRMCQVKAGIG